MGQRSSKFSITISLIPYFLYIEEKMRTWRGNILLCDQIFKRNSVLFFETFSDNLLCFRNGSDGLTLAKPLIKVLILFLHDKYLWKCLWPNWSLWHTLWCMKLTVTWYWWGVYPVLAQVVIWGGHWNCGEEEKRRETRRDLHVIQKVGTYFKLLQLWIALIGILKHQRKIHSFTNLQLLTSYSSSKSIRILLKFKFFTNNPNLLFAITEWGILTRKIFF